MFWQKSNLPIQLSFCLSLLLLTINLFAHPMRITLWHSMAGQPGLALQHVVDRFNHSQQQYEIIAIYKGDYNETMTQLVAAYRAHKAPQIVQILEIGTATMLGAEGATIPVSQLMQQYGHPLNQQNFLQPIADYYSDNQDHLVSLPFNVSSPVLFFNKTAFEQAGLDPNKPPTTWPEVEQYSQQLLKAGVACGFTTAWPAWIQIEAFSAWHNIPYASAANGFESFVVHVLYNNSLVRKHLHALAKWQKQDVFQYGGRGDNATALFTSGHCAMFTQSSGARAGLIQESPFAVGVAALPYWPDVAMAPQNTSIGGASLWVMSGFKPMVYQGIADFFNYLLLPSTQLQWQKETGYIPLTKSAYQLAKQQGYYANNPGAIVAIQSLLNKPPTLYSKGIRLGNFIQIRNINDMAIEAIFSGEMKVDDALNYAEKNANRLLQRFAELVGDLNYLGSNKSRVK